MGEYDDLIYLPHPVSRKHPPMSAMDRAAQFSPFSALTGYEAVLQEAGRLTDSRAELTEYSRDILDQKQQILLDAAPAHPEITVTCFIPDRRKQGGAYGTLKGNLKKSTSAAVQWSCWTGRRFRWTTLWISSAACLPAGSDTIS